MVKSEFFPREQANIPTHQAERNMQAAAKGLEKVIVQSLRKVPAGEGPLFAWPLVCGSAVAARTRALAFSAGILRVEVADIGWRNELQALAPRYLALMNRYTAENVSRVEFVVAVRK